VELEKQATPDKNCQKLMISLTAFPQITPLPITISSDRSVGRGGKQI
jgi:hypothetical protein